MFVTTSVIQCVCNTLSAICWSQTKQVFTLGKHGLDLILGEGDKSLNTIGLLSVDGLPQSMQLFSHDILIFFLYLKTESCI